MKVTTCKNEWWFSIPDMVPVLMNSTDPKQ